MILISITRGWKENDKSLIPGGVKKRLPSCSQCVQFARIVQGNELEVKIAESLKRSTLPPTRFFIKGGDLGKVLNLIYNQLKIHIRKMSGFSKITLPSSRKMVSKPQASTSKGDTILDADEHVLSLETVRALTT
ncbi:hypothetical protein M9H77_23347 [Catharanthus roseus]|uniref:Uncharacterized protein n=1 Tax=Catharanthus roseus TaxID=4058 RepID=A0ACC0AU01_CATRO|nr:hypothetical protein M9H77_23347 [Catharanthus roseus]